MPASSGTVSLLTSPAMPDLSSILTADPEDQTKLAKIRDMMAYNGSSTDNGISRDMLTELITCSRKGVTEIIF